ncbi:hypothetical protein P5673_002067 [Acropora cervicornis]|uniref:Uncharacterized protein n=1 Tax=Acropora cervicornis TaxID=6130 RepID=A0AAD9R4L1_ACRCE|nr:hypothetical protein P5673_002067 [Acropora cervicornis]
MDQLLHAEKAGLSNRELLGNGSLAKKLLSCGIQTFQSPAAAAIVKSPPSAILFLVVKKEAAGQE